MTLSSSSIQDVLLKQGIIDEFNATSTKNNFQSYFSSTTISYSSDEDITNLVPEVKNNSILPFG